MNDRYICDICNARLANFEFYENINGRETSRHICQVCYEKIKTSYNQFSYNPYKYPSQKQNLEINNALIRRCPVCKISEAEIMETGYAGCSDCYRVFSYILKPMIEKVQLNDRHNGKVPLSRKKVNSELSKEIENLIAERTRAIAEERYEDSQKITDRINKIREGKPNE